MDNFWISNIFYFISSYILILLLYVLVINRKRKVYSEGKKDLEIYYLVNKFKLDMRRVKYKTLKKIMTFVNPFIMSLTFIVVINIKNFFLSLLIGFIVMMLLIYSLYEIIGRSLKKKYS